MKWTKWVNYMKLMSLIATILSIPLFLPIRVPDNSAIGYNSELWFNIKSTVASAATEKTHLH